MMKKYIITIIIIFVVLPLLLFFYANIKFNDTIPISNDTNIVIPKNSSIEQIVKIFNQNGALKPSWLFTFLSKTYIKVFNKKFYAGTYRFSPKHTNLNILKAIFSGKQQYVVKITIPEGLTLKEIALLCSKKLGIDSLEFFELAHSDSILKEYNIWNLNVEGYLMPETDRKSVV